MLRSISARLATSLLAPLLFGLSAVPAAADTPTPTPGTTPTPTPVTVAAPTSLTLSMPGKTQALAPGAWVSGTRLIARFQVQGTGTTLVPEVEVEPSGTAFTGQPNFSGAATTSSGTVTVSVPISGLTDGKTYHWQARVSNGQGQSSAWTAAASSSSASFDVGVDRVSPSRPVIQSPTDPSPNRWYNNRVVVLHWTSRDNASGVAGYSYVLERTPHVIPPGSITAQNSVQLPHLANGIWFLALRSVDRAGNWSPTATFKIQLDRAPPQMVWLSQRSFAFDPYQGPTSVRFRFDKTVSATFKLYRVGSRTPVSIYHFQNLTAGRVASITWSGKRRNGKFVRKGYYFFAARAVDHANNIGAWHVGGISVNPVLPRVSAAGVQLFPNGGKRIIISLSRQTLYAYDGTKLFVQTLVTTGNPSLPTPLGHYTVMGKYHPYEFISPWPVGSPYYYAPSPVNYAMLFRSGGYFIHDAPWRSAYGPGTNGPGQPGTNYGGSHGCVNTPLGPMVSLYFWTPVGTPVDVVP